MLNLNVQIFRTSRCESNHFQEILLAQIIYESVTLRNELSPTLRCFLIK